MSVSTAGKKTKKKPGLKKPAQKKTVRKKAPAKKPAVKKPLAEPIPAGWECGQVTEAAVLYRDVVAAESVLPGLCEVLDRSAALQAAWEYGRRLRKLRELGAVAAGDDEVERELGLDGGGLRGWLAADRRAREAFEGARYETLLRLKKAAVLHAVQGKASAMRQVEQVLLGDYAGPGWVNAAAMPLKEFADLIGESYDRVFDWSERLGMPCAVERRGQSKSRTVPVKSALAWWRRHLIKEQSFDPTRMKVTELEPYLGVTRATIYQWFDKGLPRNRDAEQTVNLFEALGWQRNLLSQREGPAGPQVNPLAEKKARKLQIEIEQAEGKLVDRVSVELGLAARAGRETQVLARKFRELPPMLAGLGTEDIQELLAGVLDEFRQAAAEIPEEIAEVIPPERMPAVRQLLEIATETMDE
jgi:hypothetical protein